MSLRTYGKIKEVLNTLDYNYKLKDISMAQAHKDVQQQAAFEEPLQEQQEADNVPQQIQGEQGI